MSDKAPWITYRPELKVLDCTIRDGGLINDSRFTDDQVKAVYDTCVEAGIDYMEIGYKNSIEEFPATKYGPWRHCEEEACAAWSATTIREATGLKLAVMMDAGGKSDWQRPACCPRARASSDLVRVACYANQISEAVEMIHHAHELGYETSAQHHGHLHREGGGD
jgi:4-hydroxy 2-oxovalerate aldolase